MDRSWILDKIFNNHREHIAVEVFGLSDNFIDQKKVGPLDYERKQKLEKLEANIQNLIANGKNTINLVEDAIQSAILSRELELPLAEVMGFFNRASIIAEKYGTSIQIKEGAYQWAWTLYWWYQEYDEFYNKYCEFEKLVIGTINIYDIERLTNLWMNLYTITEGDKDKKNFKSHTDILVSEYKRFIDDKSRPNAALEAKANFVFVKLMLRYDPKELIGELTSVIKKCDGVLDFSLDTISKMILGVAPAMQEEPNFNTLFETIVSLNSNRKQELVSAQLLLDRGKQLIDSKPHSAIIYIGRALLKLHKEESKDDLIIALFLIAGACKKLDLLWASHGFYLNAFYIGLTDYMKFGQINPLIAACSDSIKMLELEQGRIPQSIEWYKLDNIVNNLLSSAGYDVNKFPKILNIDLYDSILGILFFRTKFEDLYQLTFLPDVLEEYSLFMSSIALKYALGYIDEEIQKKYNNDEKAINDFMEKWYNQPAKEQIPDTSSLGLGQVDYLRSKILGCEIFVESDTKFPCIELSESILASIESFLATGTLDKMISITPKVNIKIEYLHSDKFEITYERNDENGDLIYTINCSDFIQEDFRKAQNITKKFIFDFLADIIAHIVIFKDIEKQMENMAKDDNVFSRALDFTGSIFIMADLFGKNGISIRNLVSSDEKEYPLKRSIPLAKTMPKQVVFTKKGTNKIKKESPESKSFEPETISQKDIEIVSIIKIPLWDKAKWKGMMFAVSLGRELPILAPVFTDINAGIAIFKDWISLVSKEDEKNKIQVGLIKEISKEHPNYYKAIFTANADVLLPTRKTKYITVPSRFRVMESENNKYMLGFENAIKPLSDGWKYYLVPAYLHPKTGQPELLMDYAILKNSIEIKNAWEVGVNSWLSYAITPDDDPIIPPFVNNAPINELLKALREN